MPRVRVPVTVRWSDMDAFGHVNNVQFLRLLEEVRVRAFEDLRDGGPGMLETGVIVARHEVEYLRPMRWRLDPVAVDLWVTRIGGASFELGYEVFDEPGSSAEPASAEPASAEPASGDGTHGTDRTGSRTVYLRAATTVVTFDLASGATRRVSGAERAVLESWRDAPVPFRRRAGA